MSVSTKPRILIVDDTPENIQILMTVLKDDYAVMAATNGERALSLAAGTPAPDIILLDIVMPGIDGYEVCRRLRERSRTRSIPVVFITARSDEEDEAQGLDLGAVDYIAKPFRPATVKMRIKNHLELKRHRDDLQGQVDQQVEEINDAHRAAILALSKLAESRDDDTGKHLERTQTYCKMLATQLAETPEFRDHIDADYVETIYWASPLHDIGKVAIPDAILKKPGRLTEEEFALMQTHATHGADTLYAVARQYPHNFFLNMGHKIARSHHERWNGQGYPEGLSGETIPLCARIMAVSDVYDALTSKRCYKEAYSHEKACTILEQDSGSHFDPVVVRAFSDIAEALDQVRNSLQR